MCKVDKTQIIDADGSPMQGGINDLRMGTVDKQLNCQTCGCNFEQCPGHFGHIELCKPVYHVGFIEQCRKILRCVCFNCSRILRPSTDGRERIEEIRRIKNPKKRQLMLYNLCKNVETCEKERKKKDESEQSVTTGTDFNSSIGDYKSGCGYKQPVYRRDPNDPLKIIIDIRDEEDDNQAEKKRELSAQDCLKVFEKISDEDCYLLGLDPEKSRPEWMIIKYLAVCPPQVRPSVSVDATLRCEDDLTYQYSHILKVNHELYTQTNQGAPNHSIADSLTLLQFYVATLMNNEIASGRAQQRSGRPIKAISTRLKGKEGRLRGNLMGKRVDFSARSVISPDPNLLLDELGVPLSIAMNLTFPERVTSMNIEYLRKLVENGPTKWPGAKYIERDDGVRIDLRYIKNLTDIHLACGYIVERHAQNGDFVIFNRQPSLHKMSMMGHRIHVLPYSTFRLNLSVTTPYNADFDGDEMNMHLPQSYETKAEIVNIMHVPKQIVSPQSNKPVMSIVQDTLIGVKLFTHRDNYITYDQVMNLVMWINDFDGKLPIPAILKPVPLWTGKQIFSLILPKVNLLRFTSNHDDTLCGKMNLIDSMVQIDNGELIQGIICKRTVGNTSGGLIHCIWNEYGPEPTLWFLTNCQRVVNNWMLLSGFTVGVSDIIAEESTIMNIQQSLNDVKKEVKDILTKAQTGVLECQPGKGMIESFEYNANNSLNKARETAGKKVQESLRNTNHLKNMVIAGSKGNNTNISQIIACVGQQNVEGKRIPFNFNKRTLPHFLKDDYGAESRGFVENSYLRGLTPQEFFFHSMGGREGIIDTAVKTSETGYIQRRLIKALEDVMVKYDGTVRNGSDQVLQFVYGEDGMTGEFIEDQKIETLNMNNDQLRKNFDFFENSNHPNFANQMRRYLSNEIVESIMYRNFLTAKREMDAEYAQIYADREKLRKEIFTNGEDKQHLPVNIPRIIRNAKMRFNINQFSISDLNPLLVKRKVEELKSKLIIVKGDDPISKEAQSYALELFFIVLNYNLSCKKIIQKDRLSEKALGWVLGEIESRFFQAIVKPGEMVGNIAAQSIGEPATQMTLNTFHFAGVSSLNVTLGVPRLKEVINVAKRLKTPSMKMYLKPEYSNDDVVKRMHANIELTTMLSVTAVSEIYYDPDIFKTIIPEDQEMIDMQMTLFKDEYIAKQDQYSPWLLRLELDKKVVYAKKLDMNYIEDVIKENFGCLDIIHSEDNSDKKIFRIRTQFDEDMPKEKGKDNPITKENVNSEEQAKKLEYNILKNVKLKGIDEIKKVYVKKVSQLKYDPNTGEKIPKNEEWLIETDGTNMNEVFMQEELDFSRITTNDINEIYRVLGIEAVRKALINEVRSVLRPYDIYVNYRHICILCDVMTQKGFLTSITRHGLNRAGNSPIRKCSFEETVDILLEAGVFSEKDNLLGISENVLVGQLAPLGTGCFDLLIDLEQIENSIIPDEAKMYEMENEIMDTPMREESDSPTRTPYAGNTPNVFGRTNNISFTPMNDGNGPNFTPGYPISSPGKNSFYRNDAMYLATPNPDASIRATSPAFNPNSDYVRTPGPYSPLPFDDRMINSEYGGTGTYSPLQKSPSLMQSNSIYGSSIIKRRGFIETTTPRSVYSPTTPGMMGSQSSSSPAYVQGNVYSSTPRQDSGGSSSQYSPVSPSYNPLSPRYGGIASSYSRNSPYYNPNLNSNSNINFGGNNNNNNNNNNNSGRNNNQNNNNIQSPIQSDEEGENEN